MKQKRKHIVKSILSIMLVLMMALGTVPLTVYATDTSFSATFKYEGKTYVCEEISDGGAIKLSDILTPLEITGDVTAASVSEGQGMTVTTTAITLTKAFGTGWLRVTAGGTEYEITITSTPDSISVVLYGTLFFDKNGGSGIMDGQSVREYSTTVLPDCTFTPPDGYEFDQWEINGARYNAGATYTFGQTTTAKAIWKLREGVHSITAVYNNSDGDVVVSPTMAAAGETVTVTVQPVAGKAVDSISYSYGSTTGQALSGGDGGVYTFSMPGEDTTVSVTFKEAIKEPIAYVNENGSNQSCNDYRYVRSTDTAWSGWVVASQNLTLGNRVTVSGTVNLILMDGKTLTVTNGIQVSEGKTLNIYSQSGNTGALIAGNKQNSYAAGIGGNKGSYNAGTITVNGGQITATGGLSSAGIGGSSEHYPYLGNAGTIKICGNANVDATGGEYGSGIGCGSGGIGGSITIDGNATVQAKALEGYSGSGAAIGSGRGGYVNSITISGGTVIATGANMGSAIGNGNSNSGGDGGTISITGGDVTATATGSWGAGIGGLCKSITIGGDAVVHATGGNRGAGIGGFYQKAVGNITIEGNANVTATGGASGAGIGTGGEATGEAVIIINGGTVNASMSASNGAAAIGSGYKSEGKTTVSISGGQVTAAGSSIYGVGIGGGNTGAAEEEVVVNITGGTVNASGRAGIGTANASNAKQTINISGGTVTARGAIDGSNKCAAIGQGNNSNSVTEINITGGIVRALGTGTGIGSGANSKQTPTIKLDYTDEMKNGMEITAIDYNGTVTLNKSFKYKDGTGVVSTPITANKTIVPSDSTAHTHGFTYTVDGKTITATCTNSDNQCNLTVHKATLTIGEPDGKTSMVYDGTAKAAVLIGDTDVLTADVVYKKGNTVLPSAPSDAGNYTASITLGEATATVSYEITKKPVTFASITAKDKVYDGTTKASCSIGTGVNGAVSGDSVSANVSSGVANFDTPDVGVNKAVTFTNWTLQGSSKDNYEMVQPESQYRTITPRVITITAKAQTVPQGGIVTSSPEQVEVTSGTLAEGQQISEITLTGDTSAITTNGSITPSKVKILDASNNDVTANYVVNYSTGTLTVKEALPHTHEFTYSATGNNITATCANSDSNCLLPDRKTVLTINAPTELTYDGTAKEANVSGSIPGITIPDIVYTKDDAVFAGIPTEAGTYTASITVEGVTASVSYTITLNPIKIVPTLTVSDYTKTYDGNSVTINDLTKSAKDGSSDIEGTWDFEGTPGLKDVSDSGTITVRFMPTDTTNYESTTTTFTLTINRKDVTVKADNKSMVVGTTSEPELTATVSGTVGNDTVIYSLDREAGTVVGDYVITPSGDTLQGNYTVSYETGTFTITEDTTAPVVKKVPKAITGLVYNGTAQALVEPGEAKNGTMYYAVTTENTAPADNLYTTSNYTANSAGTYYVWYKVVGDDNLNNSEAEKVTVTISQLSIKNATVSLDKTDLVYTGSEQSVQVSSVKIGETVLKANSDYEVSGTTGTNKGDYTVTVTGKGNYKDVVTSKWNIAMATPVIDVLPSASAITYGQSLADSTLTEGTAKLGENVVEGTFSWKNDATKPVVSDSEKTEYVVVFTPNDADNLNTVECKVKVTVNKAIAGVAKAPTANTLIYNGKAQVLVKAGEATDGIMNYAIGKDDKTAPAEGWNTSIPTATGAGTYYVWYKVVGDSNHLDSDAGYVTVTIAPADSSDSGSGSTSSGSTDSGSGDSSGDSSDNTNTDTDTSAKVPYEDVAISTGSVKDITGTAAATAEINPFGTKIENNSNLTTLLSLTDAEVAQGVNVWLDVQDMSASVPQTDKTLIQNTSGDYTVGLYLDINLFKKVGSNDATKVTETKGKVKASIVIPESLWKSGRTFEIIRVHDGVATAIAGTYDENTHVFTFETDKFSTYALAYKDPASSSNSGTTSNSSSSNGSNSIQATAPKTGDSNDIRVWYLLLMASLGGLGFIGYSKKKEK